MKISVASLSNLFHDVNLITTLLDEGCDEDSSLEEVNSVIKSEWRDEDLEFKTIEEYKEFLTKMNKVADYYNTL